ncbi:hypothetical protein [Streptomyces sp. TLI_053]|nr:hypothetical protein [Streptomyces sp. TLI_053]
MATIGVICTILVRPRGLGGPAEAGGAGASTEAPSTGAPAVRRAPGARS